MSELRHTLAPIGVAPAMGGGYSHVVSGTGRLVVVSGQVAFDEAGAVVHGGAAEQAEQAFENVRRCLAVEGATFDDIVKLTYYVTDIQFLAEIRTVRDRLMPGAEKPASTAVQVVALALPELLLEIDALAVVADA
ncbi:MAG TPA: RidA family protein [Gaiellaceae bacterium]|nr:RidA family protein [Gaiellaceae bacterium]